MARALRVEKTITVRCPEDLLFSALTRKSDLARWFADAASADVREGSVVEFTWGRGREARKSRARVLRVEPGKCVMMRWEDGFSHAPDDYFSITMRKQPKGGLQVTVVDFASKDALEELDEIWSDCLDKLKAVLEK